MNKIFLMLLCCVPLLAMAEDAPAAPAPAPAPAVTAPAAPAADVMPLTLSQALIYALGNNRQLRIQHLQPQQAQTNVDAALAPFDPAVSAQLSTSRSDSATSAAASKNLQAQAGISQFFSTGTTLSLDASSSRNWPSGLPGRTYNSRIGISATQALLKGFGSEVNLVAVHQARLDVIVANYDLRGFTESLVSDTETAYFNSSLAAQRVRIVKQALDVAKGQLDLAQQRLDVGAGTSLDVISAQAELAQRSSALIDAQSALTTNLLRLARQLNPPGGLGQQMDLLEKAEAGVQALDPLEGHLTMANEQRPDLLAARIQLQRGDLTLIRTRNGLLPKLDLFASIGRSSYAETFSTSARDDGTHGYDAQIGATFDYTLGNRAAEASNTRAELDRTQAALAVANLEQLAELDVRLAYVEVQRTEQQLTATAAASANAAEKLRLEQARFAVGNSTSLNVSLAQRDLLTAQLAEANTVVSHRLALLALDLQDGSLLARRGLLVP